MRKELLKEEDLDLDPVIDVMKQAAREEFKLIDLSVSPFRCSLVSQRQVNVVLDFAKKHPNELRRAHFDATGSILSKLSPENPEMMLYFLIFPMKTMKDNMHHLRFNVAEFISESQKAITIELFLRHVISFSDVALFHEIVLDGSWAEINAVIKAFNNISVKAYLQLTFDIITSGDESKLSSLVVLQECSSHLTKTMKDDIKKHYDNREACNIISSMLGNIFNTRSWDEANTRVSSLIIVLKSPKQNDAVINALQASQEEVFLSQDSQNETQHIDKREYKQIYKDSAFYQHFASVAETFEPELTGDQNMLYSPEFLQQALKKYIAFLPFWTKILTAMRFPNMVYPRSNNGMVESYIGELKGDIKENSLKLGKYGTARPGRYINFQKDRTSSHIKQLTIGYAQYREKRQGKKKEDKDMVYEDLDSQQENWKGKATKTKQKSKFFPSQNT